MAEQSLIEAMTNDLVDDEINRNGWSDEYAAHMRADVKFRGRCARQARAALRSIHDHGPTPAMADAFGKTLYAMGYDETLFAGDFQQAFRNALRAELEGGANASGL